MKYSGYLGIAQETEVRPGVHEDVITEVPIIGDVETRTETVVSEGRILPGVRTTTTVSVFARGLGQMDNSNLRYLTYAGRRWTFTSSQTRFPKLDLFIGEEYHGPLPAGAEDVPGSED